MTSFKPFFVHYNDSTKGRSHKHPKGFTVYVRPVYEDRRIGVRIVFCSPKDQFCKKTGREECMKAKEEFINPRDLGKFLNVYEHDVLGIQYDGSNWGSRRWDYLYKYMV